ncbi:MAG: VanW family protein [Bacillota bacterium]
MEPEVQIRRPRNKKRNVAVIILLFFIALMVFSGAVFAYMTLQYDKVYKGVYIDGYEVSGMSLEEVRELLDARYQIPSESQEIILKAANAELRATFPELGVRYDTAAAAEEAYSIGRSGNVLKRFYDIALASIKGIRLSIIPAFDEGKIEDLAERFFDKTYESVKEGSLLVTDSQVVIRSGKRGMHIDKAKTAELVRDMVLSHKGGVIEPEVFITYPTKFNVDDVYAQIISEPVDAGFKVENSELVAIPHSVGRKIDKTDLREIIDRLEQEEDTERVLPVTFIMPEITSDIASSMLFRDEIGSATTYFSTGTQNGKNRKHNMELAVQKINNLVLLPGQEFSFNEVVGPRDAEHGYLIAHVYSGGKVVDGIGGGICQVSTTIYNAVLKADLEVTERRNHSFTVAYVPLGQDATAFYGGTDFRFVNSTRWPIKMLAKVEANKISITLLGTNETPGKSVIISNKILKETPYQVVRIEDPNLPEGTVEIKQEGSNGYVVETYKIIKIDGKVVSQNKLHTSRYVPCTEEVLVGTKPVGTGKNPPPGPAADKPGTDSPDKLPDAGIPDESPGGNATDASPGVSPGAGAEEEPDGEPTGETIRETTGEVH